MIDKVRRTVETFRLFEKGDRVVVGVSGGADSVALLHCLTAGLPELCLRVSVCHINHQLRGAESDRDEQFVKALCGRWNVPFHLLREDVAARARERGLGVEACGRELRYRFFADVAASCGDGVKIATAHTADDQAETVLFRLARGTGLHGLCGIPVRRGAVVRPLLDVTRAEVEAYCAANGLSFVEDSTNRDPNYARNRIRREVMPALRAVNPSFAETLGASLGSLREDDAFLWEQAALALGGADDGDGYDAAFLAASPAALQSRMLQIICRENGLPAGREKLAELREMIRKGGGRTDLTGRTALRVSDGRLFVETREEKASFRPFPLREGMLTFPSGVEYNIDILAFTENGKNIHRNFATDLIDCDKITGELTVRPREAGDRISLARRGVSKTLKKLFNEVKIPVCRRELIAVAADDAGVVWVEGIGADRRVAPDENTVRCIRIRKNEGEQTWKTTF